MPALRTGTRPLQYSRTATDTKHNPPYDQICDELVQGGNPAGVSRQFFKNIRRNRKRSALREPGFVPHPSLPGYFPAGTGLGCGFLPFDSFFLSLLPMMLSPGY